MMFDQALLPVVGELNAACSKHRIANLVDQIGAFAPGQPIGPAIAALVGSPGDPLYDVFLIYLSQMPGGFQESLRSIVYYALGTTPPTLMNFAWAPAYDWELTIWQVVEPAPANSGITVLIKSRYPSDPAPAMS